MIKINRIYNSYLKISIPKFILSICSNNERLMVIFFDILSSNNEVKYSENFKLNEKILKRNEKITNSSNLDNEKLLYQNSYSEETIYHSKIVGGYHVWDYLENGKMYWNEIRNEDNDTLPYWYDSNPDDPNIWATYHDDPLNPDDDNDGLIDETEDYDDDNDGLIDTLEIQYKCHERIPDSDFDGLLDGWEVNHTKDYGVLPYRPDIFIEVDWLNDYFPISKEEEEKLKEKRQLEINKNILFGQILTIISVISGIFSVYFMIKKHFKVSAFFTLFTIISAYSAYIFFNLEPKTEIIYEPFGPLEDYFLENDIKLHFIFDQSLSYADLRDAGVKNTSFFTITDLQKLKKNIITQNIINLQFTYYL
ncbi:MAG: hypothetical protein ACP6IY_18700 [Promethearchaeia archaeon]